MASVYRMGSELRANGVRSAGLTGGKASEIGEMLATDVIPKLLFAHSWPSQRPSSQPAAIRPEEAERLAPMAIACEAYELLERVEEIMLRGIGADRILVELLAPAARHLGREWDADRIDFVQVSMGLWRLQEVMREITARCVRAQTGGTAKSALFLAMPGEGHSFGSAMVHECFVLAGWDADLMIAASQADFLDRVATTNIDLVGLTISCDCHIERLPSLIRAVRSVSMNPNLCLMIGGCVPADDPGLVLRVGADATAATATEAVIAAEHLTNTARITAVS